MRSAQLGKDRQRVSRLYRLEKAARRAGYSVICGLDEAGRGALAGPVVAAAVVLETGTYIPLLQDSKLLSAKKREIVYREVKKRALSLGVGVIGNRDIDSRNILRATKLAMKSALKNLNLLPDLLILDAITLEDVEIPARVLVRADRKCASCAAAGVVAKVVRDRIMYELDMIHPGYGFKRHKGYGTKQHVAALHRLGASCVHRTTFAPVAQVVKQLKVMTASEE